MTSAPMADETDARTLIIDDGGPAALVACLLEPSPERASLWFDWRGPARSKRTGASRRRAELLGMHAIDFAPEPRTADEGVDAGIESARALLGAGAAAARGGCRRIVWPVVVGHDITLMSAAADRVRAVQRVLDLETNPAAAPIRFDLPLLDLTLEQVADLAIDLDAPGEAAWWCEHEGETPCGACHSCESWHNALQRARFGTAGVREGA